MEGEFTLVGSPDLAETVKLLSKHNEERKTQDRRRLDGMIKYADDTDECRMVHIRRYFEDGEPTACGHCDVCEPKLRRRRRRSRRGGGQSGDARGGSSHGSARQ